MSPPPWPAQAAAALARWQPPCQGATTPAAGVVAPAGGSPLRAPCKRLCSRAVAAPCGRRWPPFRAGPSRSQPPPCRGPWPRPGRGWPTLQGGCRPSSLLPLLRKRSKNA
ncbi:hypothetical protein BHE74_00041951 [Ensete ventricosum]|nr:hypothetical protein BHE74_00041951 [Ensete ventricosum]